MARDLPTRDLIRFAFPGMTAPVEQIKSKEVFGCNQNSHTTMASIHIPCPESQYCSIWGPVLDNSIGDPSTPSLHSLAPWKLARTEEVSRLFPA